MSLGNGECEMNIVTGSGRRRSVLALPHSSVVKRSPEDQQRQVHGIVCNMLGVKEKTDGGSAF